MAATGPLASPAQAAPRADGTGLSYSVDAPATVIPAISTDGSLPSGTSATATATITYTDPGAATEGSDDDVCQIRADLGDGLETYAAIEDGGGVARLPLLQAAGVHRATLTFIACRTDPDEPTKETVVGTGSFTYTVPVTAMLVGATVVFPGQVFPDTDPADGPRTLTVTAQSATAALLRLDVYRGSTRIYTNSTTKAVTKALFRWLPPATVASGRYEVRVVVPGGAVLRTTVDVHRGIAVLGHVLPRGRAVTWSYSAVHRPSWGTGIDTEAATALAELSRYTGLTFQRVPSGGTLTLGWGPLSPYLLGTAQYSASSSGSGPDALTSCDVTLHQSAVAFKVKGFTDATAKRTAGRGQVLLHEFGHCLGLDHVIPERAVMHWQSTHHSPGHLTAAEAAGLRWLYTTAPTASAAAVRTGAPVSGRSV